MASPRLLEIPQGSLDEPSMIPYSQSSQKNGGKAKARNSFLMLNTLRQANYKNAMRQQLLNNRIPTPISNPTYPKNWVDHPKINSRHTLIHPAYKLPHKLQHKQFQQQLNYEIAHIGG